MVTSAHSQSVPTLPRWNLSSSGDLNRSLLIMSYRPAIRLLVVFMLAASPAAVAEEDVVDFSDQITPTCELIGLIGRPPDGWFNVPIELPAADIAGCQMMRAGENDELLGLLRLLSVVVPEGTPKEKWLSGLLDLEAQWLEEMGITLGEPLFRRDDVPIAGLGDFENGTGLGLSATIEGNDTPQEVHFLGFNSPTIQYLLTLSTPARDVEEGVYYKRNTDDFGVLIRSFQLPGSD